jgi:hypothetical protein
VANVHVWTHRLKPVPPRRGHHLIECCEIVEKNSCLGALTHYMTRKEALRFPLPMPSRLALIDADFHLASHMRAFESSDSRGLIRYAPDAMALPLDAALSLADCKLRGLFELHSLKLAIVVFSSAGLHGALEMHHRDVLWKAFGLPVFEQLCGADGRVIARECEVHNGLHIDVNRDTTEAPAGMAVEILSEQCDCGLETARLLPRMAARARAAAA